MPTTASTPVDGGDVPFGVSPEPPAPEHSNPSPAAPPAAQAVLESGASEGDAAELVDLRRKLADEERRRKEAEMKASEFEDLVHRMRAPAPRARKPATAPWTFFDESPGAD